MATLCATLGVPAAGGAATFVVDRSDDSVTALACDDVVPADCSLRGAILAANARPPAEASTIYVPAGTYLLGASSTCTYSRRPVTTTEVTSEQIPLCLSGHVTIHGAGADVTIIDGDQQGRVVFVGGSAVVELRGVTITHGVGDRSFGLNPNGGGINNQGTLTLTESVVSDNSCDPAAGGAGGAGIYNEAGASLTLVRSTVSGNVSPQNDLGGGILNAQEAVLTVSGSTVSNNTIGSTGGGIANLEGVVTITDSTISGNGGAGLGGGIANFGGNFTGMLLVTNSTISGNQIGGSGGGMYNGALTTVQLNDVTITDNTSGSGFGGGVYQSGGTFSLRNTLIAGNHAGAGLSPDCLGVALTSQGHNLIQDTAGCALTGDLTGNVTGQDPLLGLLVDNGGATRTHAPSEGSPAIDAGDPAVPGTGATACAAVDQRGLLRPLGAACDIGAVERGAAPSLARLLPHAGGDSGAITVVASGDGFLRGATIELTRTGQANVAGDPVRVDVGGSALAASFDLAGRATGSWDVVVVNPDGSSATLPGGFTIEQPRAPDLWMDVIGGSFVRVNRPARFFALYGNRGNVDALGVPLLISVAPASVAVDLRPRIVPPPPHAGQIPTDWSLVPVGATEADSTYLPLVLPIVPAGFTGVLEFTLNVTELGAFEVRFTIGEPYFQAGLRPAVSAALAEAAVEYAGQALGVGVPPALGPVLEAYAGEQLQSLVDLGRVELIADVGTASAVYSVPHLIIDLAQFAVSQPGVTEAAARDLWRAHADLPPASMFLPLAVAHAAAPRWLLSPLSTLLQATEARADGGAGPPSVDCTGLGKQGGVLLPGQSFGGGGGAPPSCRCEGPRCGDKPGTGGQSGDPNDKIGAAGVGMARFIAGQEPLPYAVFFENLETASAAAQEVVVTDQLDGTKVDLETFSLGPIYFGDHTIVPPPGLSRYGTSVDLRPERNLIVGVDAWLDPGTELVTWRFTSIDPTTGALTEDPEAGFLPPDVLPPEGDGGAFFTVDPKQDAATGTEVPNQATIVFDTNDPIDTPQWSNTLDVTPPSSAVQSLSALQWAAAFQVRWAGSDAGSGVATYSVYVSDDGAPFGAWLEDTTETAAVFPGVPAHAYAFYSVARDLVGNVESAPAVVDTQTVVGDAASSTSTTTTPPTTATATTRPPPTTASTTTSTTTTTLSPVSLSGARLLLKARPGKPRKRALVLLSTDAALDLGAGNDSEDDPVLHGGSLRVRSDRGDVFDTTYDLGASAWRYVKAKGANKGYRYKAKPFASVLVKPGRLKVVAKGLGLEQSLGADPRPVRVVLTLAGRRFCLVFGGTVTFKADKKLVAKQAPSEPACSPDE